MTHRLEFATEQDADGITVARWLGDFAALTPGWARDDLRETQPRHFMDYLVGIGGVLYPSLLGLVWRLTSDSARFVLPEWDGLELCARGGVQCDEVAWEYGIDYEQPEWAKRDQGFVRAQSFRRLGPAPANYERAPVAAVAETVSWSDLRSLVPVGDQSNTTCVFGLGRSHGRQFLVDALGDPQRRPALAQLLTEPGDLVAVITQDDENSPALDSLILAGRDDFTSRLPLELEELEGRISRYLRETSASATQGEWTDTIERLVGVDAT